LSEEQLAKIRRRIDEIDGELLRLLAERVKLAGKTARLKKRLGKELRDERREREVLRRARIEGGRLGLDPNFVETFMRVVISGGLGEEAKRIGGVRFWTQIEGAFKGYPGELAVARALFLHGLRVDERGGIKCGDMRITSLSLARAAGTDRRTVVAAVRRILGDEKLRAVFANLRPLPYLRDVGKEMGWGVLEIIPKDASRPGVLKELVEAISSRGINIRQAVADDPHLTTQPKLTIITDRPIPGRVIEEIRKLPSVYSILIY
jgi:predicted regulator of amino acid metabolism with ACT domain/chorismate mutase